MNVLSENEPEITECLSQTQIVTNLLRLQNTTFQTCSRSKYSPIIPRLIFKASLFSLSPPTTNPRTSRNRERRRERQRRWGERLNLAFREWSDRCLEIFHILFTPGRFQARDRRELARASAWTQLLSLFSISSLPKRSPSANLSTPPPSYQRLRPKANKHTSGSLCWPPPQEYDRGWNQNPDRRILFMQQAHQMWLNHTTAPFNNQVQV